MKDCCIYKNEMFLLVSLSLCDVAYFCIFFMAILAAWFPLTTNSRNSNMSNQFTNDDAFIPFQLKLCMSNIKKASKFCSSHWIIPYGILNNFVQMALLVTSMDPFHVQENRSSMKMVQSTSILTSTHGYLLIKVQQQLRLRKPKWTLNWKAKKFNVQWSNRGWTRSWIGWRNKN